MKIIEKNSEIKIIEKSDIRLNYYGLFWDGLDILFNIKKENN